MNRRAFLAASAATATATAVGSGNAATEGPLGETGVPLWPSEKLPLGPLPNSRYPDTHIEALDKRFKGSLGTGAVERVATGFRWAEGPAYFRAGRYLIFSDIPNNRHDACSGGRQPHQRLPHALVQFQRQHRRPRKGAW